MPEPRLPGPDWVKLRPLYSGICGTDVSIITGKASPSLEPFTSFPAVLGHEILATVEEVGEGVQDLRGNERVVVDPFLHCLVRGLPLCDHCAAGRTSLCRNTTAGEFGPAMILGTCRDLPGGWSEVITAHRSQIFAVPAGISDEKAVLIEPLGVSLHAVLMAPPAPHDRVLIIGGGSIGLCTVAALRLLEIPCHITLLSRYSFQRDLGVLLGADEAPAGAKDGALEQAALQTGAQLHKPSLGRAVADWGFDWAYDCVGTRSSLDDALRTTRPGGTLILLGGAGEVPRLDWTFVWTREIRLLGSCGYGREKWEGRRLHTFAVAAELLRRRPEYPLERLVTHRYSLDAYQQAIQAALDRRASKAVKVVMTPNPL